MKSSGFENIPDNNLDLPTSLAERGALPEQEKLSVLFDEELIYERTRRFSSEHRERSLSQKVKNVLSSFLAGAALFAESARSEDLNRESAKNHPTNSIEQVEQAIKLEISKIAARTGFGCSLLLDNGIGKYILHIGQIHATPHNLTNATKRASVIDYQKSIAELISSLVNEQPSAANVFSEGFTTEDESICNEIRLNVKEDLAELAPDLNSYHALPVLYAKHSRGLTHLKMFMTQLNYLFQNKFSDLEKHFQSQSEMIGDLDEPEKRGFEQSLKDAREMFIGTETRPDEDAIFYYGAADKLFLDGKIYRKAAEARASNETAFKIDDLIDDAIEKMNDVRTKEELNRSVMEIAKLRASEKKLTYDIREDVALRILGDFGTTNNQQVIPLVYGASHDFSDNVLKWNKSHPKQPFGLIKVWRQKEPDQTK